MVNAVRRLRIVLYGLVGLILLGGFGFGAVLYLTQDAVMAADNFFGTLAKAGPNAAYAEASPAFRQAQTLSTFTSWADERGLRGYREANWSSRSISDGKTELSGTLSLGNGAAIPAKVTLTKDAAGAWQVVLVDVPRAGVAPASPEQAASLPPGPTPTLPDTGAIKSLARATMSGFGAAVMANNFDAFYKQSSQLWQSQTTPKQIHDSFSAFIEQKIDLRQASASDPMLSGPVAPDDNGVIKVKGYFSGGSQPWYFDFDYIQEAHNWKLVGIDISSKPIK
jgi:hypothetical protein